jgi:hypothetical protein
LLRDRIVEIDRIVNNLVGATEGKPARTRDLTNLKTHQKPDRVIAAHKPSRMR